MKKNISSPVFTIPQKDPTGQFPFGFPCTHIGTAAQPVTPPSTETGSWPDKQDVFPDEGIIAVIGGIVVVVFVADGAIVVFALAGEEGVLVEAGTVVVTPGAVVVIPGALVAATTGADVACTVLPPGVAHKEVYVGDTPDLHLLAIRKYQYD